MSESYPKSKFMKWVWTFNGLGLSLLIIATLISEIPFYKLSNMFTEEHETGLIVGVKAERASSKKIDLQHLIYQSPEKISNSDFYYAPIVVQDKDLPKDILEDIQAANDISIYMIGAPINILFFDEGANTVRRLLPQNGYLDYYMVGSRDYGYREETNPVPFALYKIALADNNGDSRINREDQTPFYMSELDGTKLRKITPDSLDLDIAWFSDDYETIFFEEIIEDKNSPLSYRGHFQKTRILYSFKVSTNEFKRFDLLQNEFKNIQNSFKNSL